MKRKLFSMLILCLLGLQSLMAQGREVSGIVTSADDGLSIPGVSVIIKGTTIGTTTDFDGKYTISVEEGQFLVFSFVGMKSTELPVNSDVINLVMESKSIGMDEVVVTGYTSHRKSEITGSTVQIKGEDLESMPVASIDQALQGRVAGVNVSSASGTPGSEQKIRIRGVSSITAGNGPLYVIDGVPVVSGNISSSVDVDDNPITSTFSSLASLNSNDIESMVILKDASATAAYGARGANGVIVINTKSGKSGKPTINFSASYGVSNDAIDGPQVLTGAEREMLYYESLINSKGAANGFSTQEGARAYYEANPNIYGTAYKKWNDAGRPETNWADIITNDNAPMQNYNLSVRGGKEGIRYYVSGGYFKQEATVIGSDFDRISGTVNLDIDLSPSLTFSTKNSGSHMDQAGGLEGSAYFSNPRAVKYFMPQIDQVYNKDGTLNFDGANPNPLWVTQNDIDNNKLTRILSNNSLTWKTPVKNLIFSTRASIDYQVYHRKGYDNPIHGDGRTKKGIGSVANRTTANYVFQNALDYSFVLDGGHDFSLKAVQEFQKNRRYYIYAGADNFSDIGLTNLSSAGNPTDAFSDFKDWSVASYLGLLHYSYNGKYIADLTVRREGSSRFSADNRWGDFWAVGAAWNISQEDFMANLDGTVSALKLRASYGKTGNANIDLNQFRPLLGYDSDYAGEGGAYPETYGNKDLSWETSYSLDLGIDFGFLDNRIAGSFGYYNRETTDMLLDVPLSLTSGFEEQTRNIGSMENQGYEFELNVDIIRSKDLNVSIGGNFATNKNEVLKLAKDPNGDEINISNTTTRVETGHPVYGWYMKTWAGVDSKTGNETWYIDGKSGETTSNFNNAVQAWQGGSAIPKLTAGMNLHVDYKGFFLDVSAYYAGGHKVYEDWTRYTNGTDRFSLQLYQGVNALLDRWQKPGDNARFGKMEYTTRPWQNNSKFLYDGDYLRLRDVSLGYDFNKNITDAIGIGGLRVYVRGTNLYTWVKDKNLKYDPETDTNGRTGLATPPVKSFIFGVNLKF